MEQKSLINEYRCVHAGERPKQLTSLEEFIWNGAYTITLLVDDKSLGLPFEYEGEEVVHLVVKDQTRNANNQNERVVVQTLTRVNRLTGHVLTYTRTRRYENCEHKWGEWGRPSGAISIINHTETTVSIMPNVMNVWGEVNNLNLSLVEPADKSLVNEYMIQFASGEIATTLTLPESIKWVNNNIPLIATNKIYQISILNGLAVCLEFYN
ncbi:MAG: hypothetical protein J6V20_03510 [Bacteroidaceae bacterium]|nr:hypothetical protein [Bacteroidaceae bacterium]